MNRDQLADWLHCLEGGMYDWVVDEIKKELAKLEQEFVNTMPTKIFGPNLEQILNAAGFYRREWVGLTDADLMKEFGYTDELLRDTAYRVEQILKERT